MMKKNFIYSLCILLCGALFMSSCEDMLEVESDRVDYDMTDLTLNDTVYSVLGILKSVQQVADRQVLFGELRGDLMVVNEKSATTEIQEIARFALNANSENKYLDVKDYYSIINNCNVYLKRVQKNLNAERDGKKPLLKEFVGVKSVRAWAYMQLALNYGSAHYFTEPILTHSVAEEVANSPAYTMQELAPILIEDIEPYANSNTYPMPNFPGLQYSTELYFVPIRQLLGDLYLWTKQYPKAIENYYTLIYDNKYVTNVDSIAWTKNDVKEGRADGSPMFNMYTPNTSIIKTNTTAAVVFSSTADLGTVSELESVLYAESGNPGSHMVVASPGLNGLSKQQVYCYHEVNGSKYDLFYNPSKEYPGDLRVYNTTSESLDRENGITYTGLITKLGRGTHLKLGRPVQAYLRMAEAILGLSADGWEALQPDKNKTPYTYGASELAMVILKNGLSNGTYTLRKQIGTKTVNEVKLDENKDTVYVDVNGIMVPDSVAVEYPVYNELALDFTNDAFNANNGIHTRGSGYSLYNSYYSISNDSCIALYYNKEATITSTPVLDENGEVVKDDNGDDLYVETVDYGITDADRANYVRDLIIDESALELAFEGYRFTDLIRFAEAAGDVDVLAKRVAGRAYENSVNYYNPEYQYDADLYQKLTDKANWFIPVK